MMFRACKTAAPGNDAAYIIPRTKTATAAFFHGFAPLSAVNAGDKATVRIRRLLQLPADGAVAPHNFRASSLPVVSR